MAQRLVSKSAVVTGGGDGIGRGVAIALAAEGARVVVNDIGRDSEGKSYADRVVEEIIKAGGTAVVNYDSVATMQGGQNIINTATNNFGRVDILVNCAGNFWHKPTMEMTEKDWDSIIDVHLKGHFSCTKAALLEMMKQKSGRVINISSLAGVFGASNPAYATAKAGIMGFTATMAKEFVEYGITVNAILPSARTKLFPMIPGASKKRLFGGDNLPPPLIKEPDFIAPIIVYLATDEAQSITGRFVYACGGDLCIYAQPFKLPGGAHTFIRKKGKWTLDELSEVIPPITSIG